MKIEGMRKYFEMKILERGFNYYKEDRVIRAYGTPENITAAVRGTKNYKVTLKRADGENYILSCTCPYAFDGENCKHEAAVMYYLKNHELFQGINYSEYSNVVKLMDEYTLALDKYVDFFADDYDDDDDYDMYNELESELRESNEEDELLESVYKSISGLSSLEDDEKTICIIAMFERIDVMLDSASSFMCGKLDNVISALEEQFKVIILDDSNYEEILDYFFSNPLVNIDTVVLDDLYELATTKSRMTKLKNVATKRVNAYLEKIANFEDGDNVDNVPSEVLECIYKQFILSYKIQDKDRSVEELFRYVYKFPDLAIIVFSELLKEKDAELCEKVAVRLVDEAGEDKEFLAEKLLELYKEVSREKYETYLVYLFNHYPSYFYYEKLRQVYSFEVCKNNLELIKTLEENKCTSDLLQVYVYEKMPKELIKILKKTLFNLSSYAKYFEDEYKDQYFELYKDRIIEHIKKEVMLKTVQNEILELSELGPDEKYLVEVLDALKASIKTDYISVKDFEFIARTILPEIHEGQLDMIDETEDDVIEPEEEEVSDSFDNTIMINGKLMDLDFEDDDEFWEEEDEQVEFDPDTVGFMDFIEDDDNNKD